MTSLGDGDHELLSAVADVDTSSEDYARRFSGATGRYFLDVQEGITLRLLERWPGARVLDVSGGHAQSFDIMRSFRLLLMSLDGKDFATAMKFSIPLGSDRTINQFSVPRYATTAA